MPSDIANTKEKSEVQEFIDDRLSFTRKVLGIVATQLLVSMGICVCASYYENFGYVMQQWWMMMITIIVMVVVIFPLILFRKKVPINYALLFTFTVCEAFVFASLTALLTTESVLVACGVLSATVTCLCGGIVICPSFKKALVFLGVAAVASIVCQIIMLSLLWQALWFSTVNVVYWGICGAIIMSVYVIIDLLYVMVAVPTDDYIMGSLMLYADIMRMFMYILMIFGKAKK